MPSKSRCLCLPAAESARPGVGRAMAIILLGEENTTGFVVWAAHSLWSAGKRESCLACGAERDAWSGPKNDRPARGRSTPSPSPSILPVQSSHVQRGNHQRRTGVCLRAVRMRMR